MPQLREMIKDWYTYSKSELCHLIVCWIHGLPEKERHSTYIQDILGRFKEGEPKYSIATDVVYGKKYYRLRQKYT
jgi:hypothetical protein